jgi:hypothetical protein
VVVEWDQIRSMRDIYFNDEVMTDGAGRISYALARKVVEKLGLNYMPSGFQGRFGSAKGFWTLNPNSYNSNEEWIEVYENQRKWERDRLDALDLDYDDPAHR